MANTPHINVREGSHILGETFFKTKLLGISLKCNFRGLDHSSGKAGYLPNNVEDVEDGQALLVLQICDLQIFLQANNPGISHICAVEEGA